ncbi:hypothetical protein KFK09_004746 [Dendrobium nobile]|uniref:Uncharacterized protein n=1 Tax=Dendrobium nobile TaxID=94219 RepID=A0A8T3BTX5_DENNO|nr:hypothetical protein KFK09_004746 [Dendrobium nobile]
MLRTSRRLNPLATSMPNPSDPLRRLFHPQNNQPVTFLHPAPDPQREREREREREAFFIPSRNLKPLDLAPCPTESPFRSSSSSRKVYPTSIKAFASPFFAKQNDSTPSHCILSSLPQARPSPIPLILPHSIASSNRP